MKNLLIKEVKLAASPLSFLFIAFGFMAMIPSYPILVGAFFVCFGVFHSFQSGRENNDILYTILLPVKKSDAVKSKFIFTVFIQLVSFVLFAVLSIVRMLFLSDKIPYSINALLNANPVYLAYILIVFTVFNTAFIGEFFKTAYKLGIPFITFSILSFVIVGISEVLHHIPALKWLNGNDISDLRLWLILVVCVVIYISGTVISCKQSMKHFDKVDM